jgi:hypothetical protein
MTDLSPPPPIEAQIAAIVHVLVDFGPLNDTQGWTAKQIIATHYYDDCVNPGVVLTAAFSNSRLRKLVCDKCANLVQEFHRVKTPGVIPVEYVYEIHFSHPLQFTKHKNALFANHTDEKVAITNMLMECFLSKRMLGEPPQVEPKRRRLNEFMSELTIPASLEQVDMLSDSDCNEASLLASLTQAARDSMVEPLMDLCAKDRLYHCAHQGRAGHWLFVSEGCLVSIDRNCSQFLTALNGEWCTINITDEIRAQTVHFLRTSKCVESAIGVTKYYKAMLANSGVYTSEGLAMANMNGNPRPIPRQKYVRKAKHNETMEEEEEEEEEISRKRGISYIPAIIEETAQVVVIQNWSHIIGPQLASDIHLQESLKHAAEDKVREDAHEKSLQKLREQAAYHAFPRLSTADELVAIVASQEKGHSNTAKIIYLKMLYKSYSLGLSIAPSPSVTPMSALNQKDLIMFLAQGVRRAMTKISKEPELATALPKTVPKSSMGFSSHGERTELAQQILASQTDEHEELMKKLLDFNKRYLPILPIPWLKQEVPLWPNDLSSFPIEFTRDVAFNLENDICRYKCDGVLWLRSEQVYKIFYHDAAISPQPVSLYEENKVQCAYHEDLQTSVLFVDE